MIFHCLQVLATEAQEGAYDGIIHAGDYAYDFVSLQDRLHTVSTTLHKMPSTLLWGSRSVAILRCCVQLGLSPVGDGGALLELKR